MAHWKDAVVTNDGVEMLNEWMAGRYVKVTSAYGGAGTVDPETLEEQTGLVNPKQKLSLLGEENGPEGKTVQVQVSNAGLAEEYELNQVGVFAKLDPDKDPDGPERLLFIMQDAKGVTIPAAEDAAFLLELYCMIGITNNGRFEVSVDAAGVVTAAYLREALERAVLLHNRDLTAHPDIRERMEQVSAASARVEAATAQVDARLTLLEMMYRTDVSGNPFTVSFDSLTGLVATGVWNAELARLEF